MAARVSARIRGVLIDLSGTIQIEDSVIPGAVQALERLRSAGVPIRFVSNVTSQSKETLMGQLTGLGFNIKTKEVFTSLTAARRLVETRNLRPLLLLEEDALRDFKGIPCEDPNAVVVGAAPDLFHYESLNGAFRLLLEGHPLIAINKVKYFNSGDGMALGPGPFVSALEYAADVKAEVIGKPEPALFQQALADMKCDLESAVMIGDGVHDDVGGAQAIGVKGILVQTGKYRSGDENQISSPPFAVCKDISEAVEHVLSHV